MKENRTSEFGYARGLMAFALCAASLALMMFSITAAPTPRKAAPVRSVDAQLSALNKIAPWVLEHTAGGAQAEFLIVLADQADFSGAAALPTKEEKGRYVRETLWNKAQETQGPLLQWLRERNIEHRPYYIVNLIWVKADFDVVQSLAARSDVLQIEGNPRIRNLPQTLSVNETPTQPDSITTAEVGIDHTRAPEVWAMGYTGQGIVVAGADTGYQWGHDALKGHYRGWNGMTANHDYNWHDSIHDEADLLCPADSAQPCDDNGHGTHTMGTVVGDDGMGNQIGMAPGAKWIGCRNMNAGVGTPATYIECMEFFLAPYPVGGTPAQGEPNLAPDVTNNSWGCPPSEGCSADSLQAAVEAQRAAGIMMVVSAGNEGSGCSTVQNPPGIYDAVYSIGALNEGQDTIAAFSSRGPVTVDGSNRPKPDLSAPGTSIRSSTRNTLLNNTYGNLSGTSMASPHVAGAVALLWSAQPTLRNDPEATEAVLNDTAFHILSNTCDSGSPATSPNNTFGHGRLDIKNAVDRALLPSLTAAVSRKVHGDAGAYDIDLLPPSGTAVECRDGNGNHTLIFTFNNNVAGGSASVTGGTGAVSGTPTFSGNTMTVNLTGVTNAQTITVTLTDVTDDSSQVLADTAISMGLLLGDVNASGVVTTGDTNLCKAHALESVTADNFRMDVNTSGSITSGDANLIKQHALTQL